MQSCPYLQSADVHAGQRFAASGIAVQHCAHSLVDAGAGGGAGMNRFTCFTIRKITPNKPQLRKKPGSGTSDDKDSKGDEDERPTLKRR